MNRELTTFVFHEVSDSPRPHARETRTYSDVKTFEKQIEWIRKFFDVRDIRTGDGLGVRTGCLITFDDGYSGLIDNALQILEAKGVPAICFINMATIHGEINSSALAMHMASREKRPVRWEDSNPRFYSHSLATLTAEDLALIREYQGPYLDIKQLKRLSDSPLLTIGDHFYNHWLIEALTLEEISSELAKSEVELQLFEAYRQIFATPHGVSSPGAIGLLKENGFQLVFSGNNIVRAGSCSVYPRIDLNNEVANIQQFFGVVAISKMRIWLRRNSTRKG